MASKVLVPNPLSLMKHVTSSGDMSVLPRSHTFGQVCLPNKTTTTTTLPTSNSSIRISSSNRVVAPNFIAPTTFMSTPTFETTSTCCFPTLSDIWREVHGCDNWEDLVSPLHPLLRQEIIRYGEFVTACYKAFDLDPNSKRYLSCKYGKKSMFQQVGMENSGYEVTKYIYATPEINIPIQNGASCGRWIGYVAVSGDDQVKKLGRRDIIITFRGTVTNHEWIANFMSSLTPPRLDPNNPRPEVKVESGFLSLYTSDESDKFGLGSCREQLLSEVSRLLHKYSNEEVSITLAGHSMGSSLALLLAYDIAELGLNKINESNPEDIVPVTVFSFGGPRVGNAGFKERCEELGVKCLRIVNVNDPITKLPGVFLNENFRVGGGGRYEFPWSCSCYAHVGVELLLDFFNMQNPSCVHDLGTYISLLKCPNQQQSADQDQGNSTTVGTAGGVKVLISRAREVLSQNLDKIPLKNAATNMVNMVQSHSSQIFLIDDNLLASLAFYIFL